MKIAIVNMIPPKFHNHYEWRGTEEAKGEEQRKKNGKVSPITGQVDPTSLSR